MTVTTNERGQQNMWATEPTMYYENYGMDSPNQVKEKVNGRWAMVGIIAGFISYALTDKFFFGIFWRSTTYQTRGYWWLKQFLPSPRLHFS